MNDPMTPERFEELADAYGGVVARWPASVRDAAMRVAAQPAGTAVLARASALDAALDAWVVPAVPGTLRDRVLAGVPAPARAIGRPARLWWSGAGIAAALAGAVAGTAAVALVPPVDVSSGGTTSFGDIGPQES